MKASRMNSMPVLVLVDVQREYVTPGRAYAIDGIGPSLDNISKLLRHARASGWEIVHVFHHQVGGSIFVPSTPWVLPIEGFEPMDGEHSVIKSDYSCFTAPDFDAMARQWQGRKVWIVGYGTTACCLATLLDAYNKGMKFSFVPDACAAVSSPEFPGHEMHNHAVSILRRFVELASSTAEILS